ncbi:LysM peptidoglycan-binding domain-containing protein [Trueperella bialowiezensis]|uniref:LysM domain/BON superfamily protein n=1 Tax=Trueperella bialowiezensis TaxID=312285 RepID=A0A3S4VU28_9ACTO|nr:LysM peptidoglycan-binding domain-containing protein [Trueperella bialowiezensis]VEI13715.1 LysM domain/BON superfamily protein [Trueperella bialowiezensis]
MQHSPTAQLQSLLELAAAGTLAFIAAWYLISALAYVYGRYAKHAGIRAAVARWGPPFIKTLAATSLITTPALADTVDLSWGADAPAVESAVVHAPAGHQRAKHTPPRTTAPLDSSQDLPHTTAPPHTTPSHHTVSPGESLWSIAVDHYEPHNAAETTELVEQLWEANLDVVEDPNLIYPGQQLRMP